MIIPIYYSFENPRKIIKKFNIINFNVCCNEINIKYYNYEIHQQNKILKNLINVIFNMIVQF